MFTLIKVCFCIIFFEFLLYSYEAHSYQAEANSKNKKFKFQYFSMSRNKLKQKIILFHLHRRFFEFYSIQYAKQTPTVASNCCWQLLNIANHWFAEKSPIFYLYFCYEQQLHTFTTTNCCNYKYHRLSKVPSIAFQYEQLPFIYIDFK